MSIKFIETYSYNNNDIEYFININKIDTIKMQGIKQFYYDDEISFRIICYMDQLDYQISPWFKEKEEADTFLIQLIEKINI